jgi:hypothetical protein
MQIHPRAMLRVAFAVTLAASLSFPPGQASASACGGSRPSNSEFQTVADVRVVSVSEGGTAAVVSRLKSIKGRVPRRHFGIYSLAPGSYRRDAVPPSNTLIMQIDERLRIRGTWDTSLPPIGGVSARMLIDLCSSQPL